MTLQRYILCFYLCIPGFMNAQLLTNISFEGAPQDATMPQGWFACTEGTTPDILPGVWGVNNRPSDGNTFLGLICRPGGSWEAIGQRFHTPLEASQCYQFTIDLARSPAYAGYNEPIRLRLWLSTEKCERDFEIQTIEKVEHYGWQTYSIKAHIKKPYEYLLIEAWFPEGQKSAAGNILLDNLRSVVKCPGA